MGLSDDKSTPEAGTEDVLVPLADLDWQHLCSGFLITFFPPGNGPGCSTTSPWLFPGSYHPIITARNRLKEQEETRNGALRSKAADLIPFLELSNLAVYMVFIFLASLQWVIEEQCREGCDESKVAPTLPAGPRFFL